MEEKVAELVTDIKKWRDAEKAASKMALALPPGGDEGHEGKFCPGQPNVDRLDWSFMPEISRETIGEGDGAVAGGCEEGGVIGDVEVIDEEIHANPTVFEQAAPGD
ncbi:hypothetical protein TIFTF001_035785 [Ficus carica]|uniref:Uncharacterized protein n=1 Tax=Ficus carica TaxID=3494 RepID=A0AA88E310_FICCA|nr:hypothetical protein TIFTF001_035785 [Ficus carica]